MEITFTDKNFEKEVLQSDKVVLVDFWAPWCGPCKMMLPVIEELAKEIGDKAKVGKCNVDENGDSAEKFDIMSIPAIKIFKGGKIVQEFIGAQPKDILRNALKDLL
jgi:thioredoxin 1